MASIHCRIVSLMGRVIVIKYLNLISRFAPKDLLLPPEETFIHTDLDILNEKTVYIGWMKLYLRYLKWYCEVALHPGLQLSDFFDAPLFIRSWYIPNTNLNEKSFKRQYSSVLGFQIIEKYRIYSQTPVQCSKVKNRILKT